MAPVDQRTNVLFVPLDDGLDPPVGHVADPAGEAEAPRALGRRVPEEDPLDVPTDENVGAKLGHRADQ